MKKKYKITNWREYNESLKQRGRVTLWLDEKIQKDWVIIEKTGKKVASLYYTDKFIEFMVTISKVFKLPLRATEGFVKSLFEMKQINLDVPDYTTISKRKGKININIGSRSKGNIHLVMDSTGIKVFGEGEWKVRAHGYSKRRKWLKFHFSVNEATKEVESVVVTNNSVCDHEVFDELIENVNPNVKVEKVSTDGGYDKKDVFIACKKRKIIPLISIRNNAVLSNEEELSERNKIIRWIKLFGKDNWKIKNNYHRRSIAENFVFRFKTIFGDKIKSRIFDNQVTDLMIGAKIINKFNRIGMPKFIIK